MPKPKRVIPTIPKNIRLPIDLVVKVEAKLYSNLQGRVPYSAWQKYISTLIVKDLKTTEKDIDE